MHYVRLFTSAKRLNQFPRFVTLRFWAILNTNTSDTGFANAMKRNHTFSDAYNSIIHN